MTDKKRIEILEKAKGLIDNDTYTFICSALKHLLHADLFKVFPELKKHKPRNCHISDAWFGGRKGKAVRLMVIDSMITEIKLNNDRPTPLRIRRIR